MNDTLWLAIRQHMDGTEEDVTEIYNAINQELHRVRAWTIVFWFLAGIAFGILLRMT